MSDYNHKEVEQKWSRRWLEGKLYQPDLEKAKNPYYNLMMFPYPSAEGLHVGNMYAFTGADMNGRFRRMMGDDVFQPIGLDGFGIHSENYAIKVGKHPAEQAKVSEERFYDQLSKIGNGFAWDNRLETYDPEYYKWTQWLFAEMFKAGLAYRKKARVNWCPSCKTVLADEQVEGGVCERCKSETTYKDLEQWFFRITAYADRLLKDIELLDWPEKIKQAQRQWIGKSEGVKETWQIKGMNAKLETFTTWPHTTWGATFIVLAPEHPMIEELVRGTNKELEVREFVKVIIEEKQRNRIDAEKVKKGIDTGRVAINPLTGWEMPIWVANFAVMDYGTGIVKGCPAHDERDFEFARKFNLLIRKVIDYDSETHSVVVKKSVGSDFTTKIEQAGWYFVDYEGWGYGVVVPKGDEQKYIDLVQSSLKRGPWYVHTDGRAKVVIYQDRIFKVESENEQAKEYGRNLNIPEEQLDWDNPEHYMFCYAGQGVMVNAGEFSGMKTEEAKEAVTKKAIEMGYGERMTDYHLRDWLISRQRYWGPPIPMVYCEACAKEGKSWGIINDHLSNSKQSTNLNDQTNTWGNAGWWPVDLDELPVRLPDLEKWQPKGDGRGPLENAGDEWLYVTCPECGGRAKRETDVSDTFLDSAWYFLAYPNLGTKAWKGGVPSTAKRHTDALHAQDDSADLESVSALSNHQPVPWEEKIIKKWLPVDAYIGGAEHAVLHLLYARFVWKVLQDLGHLPEMGRERAGGLEPFPFLFGHGLIIKDGAKMSKSRGNVVNPDEYIEQYGADALRMYLMFLGPYDQGGDFRDSGMAGMKRFLDRVWRLVMDEKFSLPQSSRIVVSKLLETIAKCQKEMVAFRYNTTIASLMELTNTVRAEGGWGMEEKRGFVKLLAPLAPFMAEEMWSQLSGKTPSNPPLIRGRTESVHYQSYPEVDESKVVEKPVVVVVQVNGKTRASLEIQNDKWKMLNGKDDVISIAQESEQVTKHLLGKEVVKTIWVEPRAGKQGLINFVVK